jgi:hypothetical protein
VKKDILLAIVAALAGIATWIIVMKLGHRREAWDSGLYWGLAMPALWITTAALAFIEPRRSWRWAVIPFAAQFVWMIATQEGANLWPLGLVFFAILSIPSLLIAKAISWHRAKSSAPDVKAG